MIFFHNFSPNSAWCHHVVQPVAEGCHGRGHRLTEEGLHQPGADPGNSGNSGILREIGDVFTGWGPQDSVQLPYFSGFMVDITN